MKTILRPAVIRKFSCFAAVSIFLVFSDFLTARPKSDPQWLSLRMQQRLQELLDRRMQDFYATMIVRERYLTDLIKSINREIRKRKDEGFPLDPIELDRAMGIPTDLINQYNMELSRILQLYDSLQNLEKQAKRTNNPSILQEIEKLKQKIRELLEWNDLSIGSAFSKGVAERLIAEYHSEVKRLLQIVDKLEELRFRAQGNAALRNEIDRLQTEIARFFQVETPEESPFLDRYIEEMVRVVETLKQLDALDQKVAPADLALHLQIREIKDRLLRAVDRRALVALRYENINYAADQQRLEEYFEEWKAKQILWIRAKTHEAELLKEQLIDSATPKQLRRMFREDVLLAAKQFNEGRFGVAALHFRHILSAYALDEATDFRFYLAECYWMQHKYDRARQIYEEILEADPPAQLAIRSLYRLMMQDEFDQRFDAFFRHARQALEIDPEEVRGQQFQDRLAIYAAVVASRIGRRDLSESFLAYIQETSPLKPAADFIHAVNLLREKEFARAIPLLQKVARKQTYLDPTGWTEAIRNEAMLKLALIYYEQDRLVDALQALNEIRGEFPDQDVALMARAWAEFRLSRYQDALHTLDVLLWNYLTSDYFYEAMMLSAHCNRLLGKVKTAIRKVRYVENAKNMRSISAEMFKERERLFDLLHQLEDLEEKAAFSGDLYAYNRVLQLKKDVVLAIQVLQYKGDPGLQLIQEFQDEEQRLVELIDELAKYQEMLYTLGYKDWAARIRRVRKKLEDDLVVVQRMQNVRRVDVFADYPLARKESEAELMQRKLAVMDEKIAEERRRIELNRRQVERLIRLAHQKNDLDALSRLEYRKDELDRLLERLDLFAIYLKESKPEIPETDFTQWADFSGFGMSDLDFVRLRTIDSRKEEYQQNVAVINRAIMKEIEDLEKRIAFYDDIIDRLEIEAIREKVRKMQEARKRYFEEQYFVRKVSEIEPSAPVETLFEPGAAASDSTRIQMPDSPKEKKQ
jgi:tetratricopeptide (TPR) repeat protein